MAGANPYYNTPYLHPKLNEADTILSKELGYGFIIGSLGGFTYHMLPQKTGSATAVQPLMAQFTAAINQTPIGNYATEILAKSRSAAAASPLMAKINAAIGQDLLGKSGSAAAAAECPLMARFTAAGDFGNTLLGKSPPAAAETPLMAQFEAFAKDLLGKSKPVSAAPPLKARLSAAISKAPLVGIQVGAWVALRAYIEYKLAGYRDKADSLNSFVSSAVVGGLASAYYHGPFVAPVLASGLLLGTGVAVFDSACNRWYFKNYERKGLKS